MTTFNTQRDMLKLVAKALGPELCRLMTFVGGCTTGLLLTDAFTREQVRSTDDVDLIVHVMSYTGFAALQKQLTWRGFSLDVAEMDDDFPICAMRLGDLRVDFMPDDEQVLGFSNRWYREVMATATAYALDEETTINLVHPVYFVATKLEAYKGRGGGDALSSRDIEDILNLVDGREELLEEVCAAAAEVRSYIARELTRLLADADFEYAVASQAYGVREREELLYARLEKLAGEHG